jgi:hypothetical protein
VNELQKWGVNNNSLRRDIFIEGQVKLMRLVADTQNRSLEISRSKSTKKVIHRDRILITPQNFNYQNKCKEDISTSKTQYLLKKIQD